MKQELVRGKKWKLIKDEAEFKGDGKTLEWLKSQPSIVANISAYENSLVKPKKDPKGKKEK